MKKSEYQRYAIIEDGWLIIGYEDTIEDCRDLISEIKKADFKLFGEYKFTYRVFYIKHDGTLGKEYKRL